jgi:hypothetical protein
MAEATATIAVAFLRAGVPVTLVTPAGTLPVAPGDHRQALDHLARVGHGTPKGEEEPLVTVRATRHGTTVRLGGREVPFDSLVTNAGGSRTGQDGPQTPDSDGDGDSGSEGDGASDDRQEVAA